jgi:hypothetical protein
MAEPEQTFKKHARWRPLFHFFVMPILVGNVLVAGWTLFRIPGLATAWGLVFALGLLALGFLSRTQALTVQDRVIRLEMRLKLRGLLPPDLQPRINELTHRQLVALRFASDAELPELVREVLAGKLATSKEIKMRVRSWQSDWLRT